MFQVGGRNTINLMLILTKTILPCLLRLFNVFMKHIHFLTIPYKKHPAKIKAVNSLCFECENL